MSAARDGPNNLSAEERRKIGEVIRGQEDNSTAWMYEQPKKNAEDFLLGKAVKSLEELAEISRDDAEETPAQRLARLDMQAKYREDPLNLMRQHELDKRNALLQNTAKMKKLQRLIEKQKRQQQKRDHRRKRKKGESKHSTRHHHHHHHESNNDSLSSSGDSEDDAILDKFINLIQQQEPGVNSSGLHSLQQQMKKKNEEKSSKKKKSKDHSAKKEHKHKHHDREKHSRKRSRSPKKTEEGKRAPLSGSPIPISRRSPPSPKHKLPAVKRRPSPPPSSAAPPRRSREEMAALRAQMAADAKERERERVERFQRHQTETKQQEALEIASRDTHGASFLKGLTLAHVATSSVEEGVQRKASSRQRGGMEDNFLRH
uniref:Pre-mRNA splicing factor n=3 Tax=Schistocephalus solidus TaxID=70667 RepID=A0A0X3NHK2_SCHSO